MKPLARLSLIGVAVALTAASLIFLRSYANRPESFKLVRIFPTEANPAISFEAGIHASPLLDTSQAQARILLSVSDGTVVAVDTETGAPIWQVKLPAPEGHEPFIMATPVQVEDKLVLTYQTIQARKRKSHRMAVVDLAAGKLDPAFPVVELKAEKSAADRISTVSFLPSNAFSHAALKHARKRGSEMGYVYVGFGNAADIQPWHGWVFEIDLDGWRRAGPENAVSGVLLVTPETHCPVEGKTGSQDMICGGGVWGPGGPLITQWTENFELFVTTGNGQIDLDRRDFSNTVMRLRQGLAFDPGCDAELCADFDPKAPSAECMSSCTNLFIPRPEAGNAPLKPASGACDDKDFWECLAFMDYDLGASSPVRLALEDDRSVLVQPGKEGAIYLIDADHLGTQYDRMQIVEICGTKEDPCTLSWRGMIVTQPAVGYVDDKPVIVVPTFMSDDTQPAGLVALTIRSRDGTPKFEKLWQMPRPDAPDAARSFRSHPSLPVIARAGNRREPYVWVVDVGGNGVIYAVRLADGSVAARQPMEGTGRPLAWTVVLGDRFYATSNSADRTQSWLEGYRIEALDAAE